MNLNIAIRILFGLAFGGSIYLAIKSSEVGTIAGCGGESGCGEVLGSSWAYVLGKIPVSVLGAALYLGGILASWFNRQIILLMIAAAAGSAAIWFAYLQGFVVGAFCPYCSAVHGFALLASVPVLFRILPDPGTRERAQGHGHRSRGPGFLVPVSIGVAATAMMALLQAYGPQPETHAMLTANLDKKEDLNDGRVKAGKVMFLEGNWTIDLKETPHFGATKDGSYAVLELFDYSCKTCRQMASYIDALEKAHPGKFCIVAVPSPLNSKCNPHLPTFVEDHLFACEFAELALAVFQADASKFSEFHHWMMKDRFPPTVSAAKAKAAELLGSKAAVENALADERIAGKIKDNVALFRQLTTRNIRMPKVVMKTTTYIQGVPLTPEKFIEQVEKQSGFKK